MNLQQFIDKPELINSLTQSQKIQLFQQLTQHKQTLQQEKIKLETELDIKTKEQQDLFTKLKTETNQPDLASIKTYIDTKQSEFDKQLISITTEFKTIQ